MAAPAFIEPGQLAGMLRGPEGSEVLVIDVRDEDFVGGHIKGAVNIESEHFYQESEIDSIIDQHLKPKPEISKVVLHCMFSQQRGPRCASRLAKRLDELQLSPKPDVLVLRGGFVAFGRTYKHEGDLVEDYDATTAQWE